MQNNSFSIRKSSRVFKQTQRIKQLQNITDYIH